jgi:hypothetical protein
LNDTVGTLKKAVKVFSKDWLGKIILSLFTDTMVSEYEAKDI